MSLPSQTILWLSPVADIGDLEDRAWLQRRWLTEYYVGQVLWSGVYFQGRNMPNLYFTYWVSSYPIFFFLLLSCGFVFVCFFVMGIFFFNVFYPACKYDLAGWWELPTAFPTGNSLGQQRGIHEGLYLPTASSPLHTTSLFNTNPSVLWKTQLEK